MAGAFSFPELSRHDRAVLLFSGGKESVALAHMLEPHRDRIELVWVDTGAMLPHMAEFIRGYGERWRLVELHSDQPARLRTVGLPSRIVPMFNTPAGAAAEREPGNRVMVTDWISCCGALRGQPVADYMRASGITLLFHGQRRADNFGYPGGWPAAEVSAPLWNWSEGDVLGYIEDHRLTLPRQYPTYPNSIECWNCSAELGAGRIRWIKENYPERMPELRAMLGAVTNAVISEMDRARPGIVEAMKEK